jgi:hypothetical protein
MSLESPAFCSVAAFPPVQKQSNLSLILNHEQADQIDSHDSKLLSEVLSKSDQSSLVDSDSLLGKDRSDIQSTTSSSASEFNKRQKIEMAISELNLDEEVIRDLKDAFNCSSASTIDNVCGNDAATALLGLRKEPVTKREDQAQKHTLQPFKSAHARMQPYYAAVPFPGGSVAAKKMTYHPQTVHSIAAPQGNSSSAPFAGVSGVSQPRFIPFPPHQHPPQVRRVKEYTSFSIKLRQNDRFWEILSLSPEFEERQVKIKLVNSTQPAEGGPQTDTVLIEASKFLLIRCANNSTIEKVVSAKSMIPLRGKAVPNSVSITCLRRGYIRIRIEKQR